MKWREDMAIDKLEYIYWMGMLQRSLVKIICTFIWFQVFISNTKNFQKDLFVSLIGVTSTTTLSQILLVVSLDFMAYQPLMFI